MRSSDQSLADGANTRDGGPRPKQILDSDVPSSDDDHLHSTRSMPVSEVEMKELP